jgi:hypothetical protein
VPLPPDPARGPAPRSEKELDQPSLRLGSVITFPTHEPGHDPRLSPLAFGGGLARQDEAWIGMIIYGNRQPCIGNLPKKPKMPSSSKNL